MWPWLGLVEEGQKQGPSGEGVQDPQRITERQDKGHAADDESEPGDKVCKGCKTGTLVLLGDGNEDAGETLALLGDWKTDDAETLALLGDCNEDACDSSRLLCSRYRIGCFEGGRGKSQVATQRNKEDAFLLMAGEIEGQK